MKIILHLAFVIAVWVPPAWAGDPAGQAGDSPATRERREALASIERGEPTLPEVRAAALRYAGVAGRAERRWRRRARLSGLLPVLTVRAGRGSGSDRDLSRSSVGTERLDIGSDVNISFEARAVWNLDRLVFSDLELRAARAAQTRHSERARLLAHVTGLYYQRRKLQIAAIWSPSRDPGKAAAQKLAIAELSAQLDALTGGYFSRALGQNKRALSPTGP